MYQSELTQFLNRFLEEHPAVDAQRRELRLTLWDKEVDMEAQRRYQASEVAQKPYVYQPE